MFRSSLGMALEAGLSQRERIIASLMQREADALLAQGDDHGSRVALRMRALFIVHAYRLDLNLAEPLAEAVMTAT